MTTAIGLGGVPKESFLSAVYGAIQISQFGKPILRFDGSLTGWILEIEL
ncbi:hypothetical protein [Photobacterium phosphoreum]|nr:hypothetical protein [Photobacterium phosphoreum]